MAGQAGTRKHSREFPARETRLQNNYLFVSHMAIGVSTVFPGMQSPHSEPGFERRLLVGFRGTDLPAFTRVALQPAGIKERFIEKDCNLLDAELLFN
jgi:hypothetical protein